MRNPMRKFPRVVARALIVGLVGLASACGDTEIEIVNPITPTPPAAPRDTLVEFRVTGDLPLVQVRVQNSLDGLSQASTVLPYSASVVLRDAAIVFVSLDARATGTGFLHAAIFVDGVVFR